MKAHLFYTTVIINYTKMFITEMRILKAIRLESV